jgi:hypothetical protein
MEAGRVLIKGAMARDDLGSDRVEAPTIFVIFVENAEVKRGGVK